MKKTTDNKLRQLITSELNDEEKQKVIQNLENNEFAQDFSFSILEKLNLSEEDLKSHEKQKAKSKKTLSKKLFNSIPSQSKEENSHKKIEALIFDTKNETIRREFLFFEKGNILPQIDCSENKESLYVKALEMMSNKDYESVLPVLRCLQGKYSVTEERYYWAKYNEGFSLIRQGFLKDAIDVFETLINKLKNNSANSYIKIKYISNSYNEIGNIYEYQNDLKKALCYYQKASSIDSEDIIFQVNETLVFYNQKEINLAVKNYRKLSKVKDFSRIKDVFPKKLIELSKVI